MTSKLSLYAVIVLLAIIIGQYFITSYQKSQLIKENNLLKVEKTKELIRVRDSAIVTTDKLIKNSKLKLDSLISLPPTIKWKSYEKPVYPNRTLDISLDIHARHKADTRAAEENN